MGGKMSVSQRRQTHPLHLFNQQRNVVDSLCNDVGDFMPDFSVSLLGEPTTQRNRMRPMKVFEI